MNISMVTGSSKVTLSHEFGRIVAPIVTESRCKQMMRMIVVMLDVSESPVLVTTVYGTVKMTKTQC